MEASKTDKEICIILSNTYSKEAKAIHIRVDYISYELIDMLILISMVIAFASAAAEAAIALAETDLA